MPRQFYKRRLIRLQPMVVLGSLIGGALFYFQAGGLFPKIAHAPVWQMLLVMRLGWRVATPHAFAICGILLVAALALPRMGSTPHHWANGLYDALCVILVFPVIVAIGAGQKRVYGVSVRIARFFGDLSFPLYITHYPLVYVYTAWVVDNHIPPRTGAVWGVALVGAAIAIAYASLKLYDEPVRRWLSARFLTRTQA